MADALPSGHKDHWEPGSKAHFEYRCYEGHDSGDAQAWYRSHRPVTVLGPEPGNDGNDPSWDADGFKGRGAEGMPRSYRVKHDTDGFEHSAWEDELLVHPKHFVRPDPPAPKTAAVDHGPIEMDHRDFGRQGGVVSAMHGDDEVGMLSYHPDGKIDSLWVHPEHRRKGIATQMWNHVRSQGIDLQHSNERTPAGSEWSKAMGDHQPHDIVKWDNSLYSESAVDHGPDSVSGKDDFRWQTGEGQGHVTYHVEVEHGRRRPDAVTPERGPVTPAYLNHPVDKSYLQLQVDPHGKTLDEMDQEAHKGAYDVASATSPHDMVTKTRILHVEASADAMDPHKIHPNLNRYRSGGIGHLKDDEDRSVVGMVPTHVLARFREHDGYWGHVYGHEGGAHEAEKAKVESIRKDLRSGHGLEDPLLLEYDHTAKRATLGEGNHRLRALEEEGHTHAPVRVYGRARIADDEGAPLHQETDFSSGEYPYQPPELHPHHFPALRPQPHLNNKTAASTEVQFTDLGREPVDYGTEKHLRKFHEEVRTPEEIKSVPIHEVHPGQMAVDRDPDHVRDPEKDAKEPPRASVLPNGHYKLHDGHHRFADALQRGDTHFTVKTMSHGSGPCRDNSTVVTGGAPACTFDWFMEDAHKRMNKTSKTASEQPETHTYYRGLNMSGKGSEDIDWDDDSSVVGHLNARNTRYTSKADRGRPDALVYGRCWTDKHDTAHRFALNTGGNMGRRQSPVDRSKPVYGAVLEAHTSHEVPEDDFLRGYGEGERKVKRESVTHLRLHLHRLDPEHNRYAKPETTHVRTIDVPASAYHPTVDEKIAHHKESIKFHKEWIADGHGKEWNHTELAQHQDALKALRTQASTGKHEWLPHKRIFGPTYGLDHRLFDNQVLKPDVRRYILHTINTFWKGQFPTWHSWSMVYFAGSEASEWTSPELEGNNDFDVLIGVDYDKCRSMESWMAGLDNEQITALFNKGFREHLIPVTDKATIVIDGVATGPWDNTFYVNKDSYDIRAINPYAAYNVTLNEWAVRPPHLPDWGPDKFPAGDALWDECEAIADYIKAVLSLPEPFKTQQATALWDHLHSDRARAFGPDGEGWLDPGNVIEKYLDQHPEHLWERLSDVRFGRTSAQAEGPQQAEAGKGKARSGRPGSGAPLGDEGAVQSRPRALDQDDDEGASRGPAEVVHHAKVPKDLKALDPRLASKALDLIDTLAAGERHTSTHRLHGLKGWDSTHVDRRTIIVHQHREGTLHIGGVFSQHDYDQASRRLAAAPWKKPGDTMTRMAPADLLPHVDPRLSESSQEHIDHLTNSMKEVGWHSGRGRSFMRRNHQTFHEDPNPITLWHTDEGSFVEPGNHRVPAAHAAGLPSIPVLVKDRRTKTANKDPRFEGVSLKQDDDGWYVTTHRARSKSYPTPDDIPKSKIDFIESTGALCPQGHAAEVDPDNGLQHLDGSVAEDCQDPDAFRRLASEAPTSGPIHRGMIVDLPTHEIPSEPKHLAHALTSQRSEVGMHWTDDHETALRWAHHPDADDPDPGHTRFHVVVHGEHPGPEHAFSGDRSPRNRNSVFQYSHEWETPIHPGAPVKVHGVSWLDTRHPDYESREPHNHEMHPESAWKTHEFAEPVTKTANDEHDPWASEKGSMDGYRVRSWHEDVQEAFDMQRVHEDSQEDEHWMGYKGEERHARENGYQRSNIADFRRHMRLPEHEAMPSKKYVPPQGLRFEMYDDTKNRGAAFGGQSTHALNAWLGGEHVGYVRHTVEPDDDHVYVDKLHVGEQHQRKGIGSALMDAMYQHYPNHVIDHGDRTPQGASWWKTYEDPHPERSHETGRVVKDFAH